MTSCTVTNSGSNQINPVRDGAERKGGSQKVNQNSLIPPCDNTIFVLSFQSYPVMSDSDMVWCRARMIHAILDDKGCDGDVDVEIERLFGNINGMMGQLVI